MKIRRGAVLPLFIVALAVVGMVVTAAGLLLLRSQPRAPEEVAAAFARALMRADADGAKALAAPAQQARLDAWLATAEPFSCRRPFVAREQADWGALGCAAAPGEGGTRQVCAVRFDCRAYGSFFAVWDVALRRTEDGWRVEDWGAVEGVED